jgi:predicted Zn-dependent protease
MLSTLRPPTTTIAAAVACAIALGPVTASAQTRTVPAVDPGIAMASKAPLRDRQAAARQHPEILAQFGGEVTGPLSTYVKGVGAKVAVAAGLRDLCVFTVVNTDVVNAFAVPGCHIYVTRGLLTIMNSEDELASVLGHEVGHVVAEHSKKRTRTATLSTLGALAAGVLTKSQQVMQAAGQIAQLYTLSFSRNQEFESDDLGVRYLRENGYNPFAASDMLAALGVHEALDAKVANREARQIPNWARTHPISSDRVARTDAAARTAGATRESPLERVRPYLDAIDGMLVGDDPEQGFVNGRTFSHPGLRLTFEAPTGFTLTNTPRAVQIAGPGELRAQFGGGTPLSGGLDAHVTAIMRQLLGQTPAQTGAIARSTVNGLPAASLLARVRDQRGRTQDAAVMAYDVGGRAYHFIVVGPGGGLNPTFPMTQSLRQLTPLEASSLRPRRIEVVTVRAGDTVESLSARMAYQDFQIDRFRALNALNANQSVRAGDRVKIVALGPATTSASMQAPSRPVTLANLAEPVRFVVYEHHH